MMIVIMLMASIAQECVGVLQSMMSVVFVMVEELEKDYVIVMVMGLLNIV